MKITKTTQKKFLRGAQKKAQITMKIHHRERHEHHSKLRDVNLNTSRYGICTDSNLSTTLLINQSCYTGTLVVKLMLLQEFSSLIFFSSEPSRVHKLPNVSYQIFDPLSAILIFQYNQQRGKLLADITSIAHIESNDLSFS